MVLSDLRKITQLPILIVSTPRSGSTALLFHIKEMNPGLHIFNEPSQDQEIQELQSWVASRNHDYILKLHVNDLITVGITANNLHQYYSIRLLRQDTISQITSLYISTQRKKYYYTQYETQAQYWHDYKNDPVTLDADNMLACCKTIIHATNSLNQMTGTNLDIVYEDVQDMLYSSGAIAPVVAPKPANYQQIKQLARRMLATLYHS